MYAIIEDSGTQIKVSEGDTIKVDVRDLPDDSTSLTFDRVLMIGGEGEPKIGRPLVDGASVEADILAEERDRKVEIVKYRRRKTYKRRRGHRQNYIKVQVTAIKA